LQEIPSPEVAPTTLAGTAPQTENTRRCDWFGFKNMSAFSRSCLSVATCVHSRKCFPHVNVSLTVTLTVIQALDLDLDSTKINCLVNYLISFHFIISLFHYLILKLSSWRTDTVTVDRSLYPASY